MQLSDGTKALLFVLKDRTAEWQDREEALLRVEAYFQGSTDALDDPASTKKLLAGLGAQIVPDERKEVVRAACDALLALCAAMTQDGDDQAHRTLGRPLQTAVLPALLAVASSPVKANSWAACRCMPEVVALCYYAGLLKVVCAALKSTASPIVKRCACECIQMAVQSWPPEVIGPEAKRLEAVLLPASWDNSAEVRALARQCLSDFAEVIPERAPVINQGLAGSQSSIPGESLLPSSIGPLGTREAYLLAPFPTRSQHNTWGEPESRLPSNIGPLRTRAAYLLPPLPARSQQHLG